jgi:hypothetical protein
MPVRRDSVQAHNQEESGASAALGSDRAVLYQPRLMSGKAIQHQMNGLGAVAHHLAQQIDEQFSVNSLWRNRLLSTPVAAPSLDEGRCGTPVMLVSSSKYVAYFARLAPTATFLQYRRRIDGGIPIKSNFGL